MLQLLNESHLLDNTSKNSNSLLSTPKLVPDLRPSTQQDHRHQVLLITNDPTTSESFQRILGGDFHIVLAQTLEQGITYLFHDCPAVIVCDGARGIKDLVESVNHADFCDVPVLVIEDESNRKKSSGLFSCGVSDIIYRPIESLEVKHRIQNQLECFLARRILQAENPTPARSLSQLAKDLLDKTSELIRINRLKDEFMAMLSHELRNPINVISGFAEILLSNPNDKELAQEAAQAIHRNAQFQVKLVQDLMDISRSINGKLILDCKPLELQSLLKDIISSVKNAAEKKRVNFQVDIKTPGLIFGDSARISQVIWNLLSNAIKFTPEGGQVSFKLLNRGSWVELTVQDTGVGIDPEFLPHIFEQFHQQNTTITKNFGGLGLGLAIVKHIVELHRGIVQACSDGVGHGATFTVRLPSMPN